MTDKPSIRITSEGRGTAQVLLNGRDISNHVSAVTWHMEAGRLAETTVTLFNVAIDADGNLVAQTTHALPLEDAAAPAEHRACGRYSKAHRLHAPLGPCIKPAGTCNEDNWHSDAGGAAWAPSFEAAL